MKRIGIGILGFGTVGRGTFELLERNRALIARRAGCELEVVSVVTRTPARALEAGLSEQLLARDASALLSDPNVEVVAELIGGVEPARDYVLRALRAGKSVVTANKELLAKHGAALRAAARESGVDLLCEGAVGGGIPLLKPLRESLAGNRIDALMGIINGTTNFILSRMTREGAEFATVLERAQQLGYAEADPTADIEGFDAAYKLSILAGIAFDTPVDPLRDVFREGITQVGARDVSYANELGYVIKLIALAKRTPAGALELRVHPTLLPRDHPLSSVHDAFNAVLVSGDAVGDVMFYGQGAGAAPTGSAVVGDLIEAARNRCRGASNPELAPQTGVAIAPFDEHVTRFCVRMQVADKPGTIARIATAWGEAGVSIESIVQRHAAGGIAEIFWMTHHTTGRALAEAKRRWDALDSVREVSSVLRVEGQSPAFD